MSSSSSVFAAVESRNRADLMKALAKHRKTDKEYAFNLQYGAIFYWARMHGLKEKYADVCDWLIEVFPLFDGSTMKAHDQIRLYCAYYRILYHVENFRGYVDPSLKEDGKTLHDFGVVNMDDAPIPLKERIKAASLKLERMDEEDSIIWYDTCASWMMDKARVDSMRQALSPAPASPKRERDESLDDDQDEEVGPATKRPKGL